MDPGSLRGFHDICLSLGRRLECSAACFHRLFGPAQMAPGHCALLCRHQWCVLGPSVCMHSRERSGLQTVTRVVHNALCPGHAMLRDGRAAARQTGAETDVAVASARRAGGWSQRAMPAAVRCGRAADCALVLSLSWRNTGSETMFPARAGRLERCITWRSRGRHERACYLLSV